MFTRFSRSDPPVRYGLGAQRFLMVLPLPARGSALDLQGQLHIRHNLNIGFLLLLFFFLMDSNVCSAEWPDEKG